MTTATLDKQINNYLVQLNPKQKKAVLTVVKIFAEDQESLLNSPSYLDEMNRRIEELEKGSVEGSSWEDVKQKARRGSNNSK